jgi:hypothetical protein
MKTLRSFSTVLATAGGLLAVLGAPVALAAPGDLLPLAEINYGVPNAHFGSAVAAVGSDRFVVSAPNYNYTPHLGPTVTNCGIAYVYDLNTNLVNTISNPDPRKDDYFGWTLASVGSDMFAVGAPYKDVVTPPPASFLLPNVGAVYLYDHNGTFVRTFNHPTPGFNDADAFGMAIAPLGTDRILIGAPDDEVGTTNAAGKVFLFDLNGTLLQTLQTPQPSISGRYGAAITALSSNRFVVGAPGEAAIGGATGRLYVYDGTNLVKTITHPTAQSSYFGSTLATIGTNGWFAVGSPLDDVQTTVNGIATNVLQAGKVHIYDQAGVYRQSIASPTPSTWSSYGSTMARVGNGRFVVGASYEMVNGEHIGNAYLYNLDGLRLTTFGNTTPMDIDSFGDSVAGVGQEYIVVGASGDSTKSIDGGSVYLYQAPILEFYLGSEIVPPLGVPVNQLPVTGPEVQPPGNTFWHYPSKKLFATKAGPILIAWPLANSTNYVQGINVWPTNAASYQIHVAGSPPISLTNYQSTELLQTDVGTGVDPAAVKTGKKFESSGPGRSLLRFSPGQPETDDVYFQLVRSIAWNDPAYLHDNAPAVIGTAITNTYGYHDTNCGGPFVVQSNSVYCALPGYYDRVLRSGPIIPVNTDKPGVFTDDIVVAYYQKGTRLKNGSGANVSSEICWPWKPVRYNPQWPTNAPTIVIASQKGTDAIDAGVFENWALYYQNDPALAGFNPNDEHALVRPYGAGQAIFALRDDLGTPLTSDPYVLMTYRDPQTKVGRMQVWRVVAQGPETFHYPGTAGTMIQPPLPLSVLALCNESSTVSGPTWRDRKLAFWANAANDDGSAATVVMRYFYPAQPEFYFPAGYQPLPNGHVPWLDLRAGTPGTPVNVNYTISWPAAPELHVAETLWKPKNGLPDISQQSSVEIIYQQSTNQGHGPSVQLIDPVQTRFVNLVSLPAGIVTVTQSGLVYFPNLPPQLRDRFWFDPVQGRLNFRGQIVQPPAGEPYLLLNVITEREKTILLGLSNSSGFHAAINALANLAQDVVAVTPQADAKALTAGNAQGTGYVTLAFGNGTNSPANEPVSLEVVRVVCPFAAGAIEVIESSNPFDEKLTLRHSGDFGGHPDQYVFEWRTLPPNGGVPQQPPDAWTVFPSTPPNGQGAVDITLQGAGLQTLSDNYFVCRYRSTNPNSPCGSDWSPWTGPMLAEGWIKRVLGGINPFEQKIKSYQDNTVNTIVSMISQAGARSVGNVPLNQQAADNFGLIEIYETVLKRGLSLSIEGTPAVNYPPANDALLLAAGRIADLYLLLGNEAFADAADPTIAIGTDDGTYGLESTSLHCFMNQTDSLLEEELALLRGRDDTQLPGVQTYPVYNRLLWNFTHDINGGEVAYALNYNIQDQDGDAAGTIDEVDARALYPQGHGDAWGHYLTAIKNYYHLLRSTNFTWVPRAESVLVGGVPVSVDYLDERKFAHAASSRAQTGAEIVNLTYRGFYVEDPKGQYQGYRDSNTNRAWGLAEWGSRAGQGALFDWITANAILPAQDANPNHAGIQKVDRTTVKELNDIASSLADIQVQVDNADRGLNPLGLAKDILPFDIDPALISQGKTHFEQIYDRAVKALNNAIEVFNHANNSTQLLRRQADSAQKFKNTVQDREADFNNRLIEIFGYPYADDIGGAGSYPAGYVGPDIYHYDYVDASALLGSIQAAGQTLNVSMKEFTVNTNGALNATTKNVPFNVGGHGLGLVKPASWTGQRQAPGEIQMARSDLLQARGRFDKLLADYNNLLNEIQDQSSVLVAQFNANLTEVNILNDALNTQQNLWDAINEERDQQKLYTTMASLAKRAMDAAAEALPTSAGTSIDPTSVGRGALQAIGAIESGILGKEADRYADMEQKNLQAKELEQARTNLKLTALRNDTAFLHQLAQLEQLIRQEVSLRLETYTLDEALHQASGRYQAALSRGVRLLDDRLRFRRETAAEIQSYRYKDMAFRIFRNDALQKYRAQYDLAARYVYMAARAYDFETCLSPGDARGPGEKFLTDIIRSRSLGVIEGGEPHTGPAQGDAGLADPMARMHLNWDLVLKGQLGFNNAQTETGRFSLRSENFRVQPGFAGNIAWRQKLTQLVVSNLLDMPEFQRYCIPFQPMLAVEPGIVIPFSTTVNFGQNFFGWPAGGGDNDYDSTHFATKIRSVGVWFANYNNLGAGMINTPRVYLVPVGNDVLRSPTGSLGHIREWTVMDQLLPVPFPLSGDALSNPNWIPMNDTLVGDLGDIRKFARFRAYHDSGAFDANETINDSRLVGRSVWNTRWLLIIPAGSLHSDRNEGLERFINGALDNGVRDGNGVSDIKIFFQTYAYAGN